MLNGIKEALGLAKNLRKEERTNVIGYGTSGTEIYGGYIFEEYLKDLRGSKLADIVDKMRRSDPIVKMILRALKLPLLSQNWFIEQNEESKEAEWQKKLFDKVVFNDMSDSFTKTLAEILTCEDFGYSLFEKVHGVSFAPELGQYNTVKRLAFRSQRTIERWKVDKGGSLICVYQMAFGDIGKTIEIPAQFLVHFAPEMEGDNFEGMSKLRPCYGPWLRKNEFLKLLAAGIEKYAIPTPILEVPAEKTQSEEFDNAVEALECYTSNQSQYLTFPEGWKLSVTPTTFDSEKVRKIIDSENQEMVNSVMASFLLLGQGSSGSYSLSKDLSNFFAQSLQATADHISEVIQKHVMQDVLDLNKPGQKLLCSLRCDNLRDNADKEFAETLKAFSEAGIIQKDSALEEFVREKYKYPKKEDTEENKDIDQIEESPVLKFAEKKSPKRPDKLIDELSDVLKEFFRGSVLIMCGDLINQINKADNNSRNIFQATLKLDDPTTRLHAKAVKYLLSRYAVEAKKYVAFRGDKKLSEVLVLSDSRIDDLLLQFSNLADELESRPDDRDLLRRIKELEKQLVGEMDKDLLRIEKNLSRIDKDKIKARAQILVDTQASDVYKDLSLTAQANYSDSSKMIFQVSEATREIASGPIVNTGSDILANTVINDTMLDYAKDEAEGIKSVTFIAEVDDRTTDICLALNGKTFDINDPDLDEYSPPLHYNCRSYLQFNFNNVEITGLPLLSKEAQKSINLSECCGNDKKISELIKKVKYANTADV
jgi:hypothetical protein